jgi:hypothetical protein
VLLDWRGQRVSADDGWVPLFNGKNFDGWYTYVESNGKNSDPTHVFKVETARCTFWM